MSNQKIVLISGETSTGKSYSLKSFKDDEGILYLNCEGNKPLPFRAKFKSYAVTNPFQVYEAFVRAETPEMSHIHTIVVDTLSSLVRMFEYHFVHNSKDSRKAWGDYAAFVHDLIQHHVAKSSKNVIIYAHLPPVAPDEERLPAEQRSSRGTVIKGAWNTQGIESLFGLVISTKKVPVSVLENYSNPLLTISPREKELGFKYVFQTQITKDTLNERMRGPDDLFSESEVFINNDLKLLLDRIQEYYS